MAIAVFEDLPVGGIGQAGIGDTGLARSSACPQSRVQPLVDFEIVHPGDEKMPPNGSWTKAVSGLPGTASGQVVHHLAVPLHGERSA